MLDQIPQIVGETLDHAAYHEDFARESDKLTGVIWKLERAQTFREPGDPSWEAFMAGDWAQALRILAAERQDIRADAQRNADRGLRIRRVRIVEHPVSPYLQWEMHALHLMAKEGFDLRVLDAVHLRDLERDGPLPEVVIIGDQVLYQVRYDARQTPCGAWAIHDPEMIRQATAEISDLHHRGEPLTEFFDRQIAPLPAPTT
jgi:Family of unknown function (DUF6879)